MFLEVQARVVLALSDPLAVVAVPGARFLDHIVVDAELDQLALARCAFAVEDFELGLPERWCDLVLDDLDARFGADDFFAALHRADTTDVEAHRSIELQRIAASRRLG